MPQLRRVRASTPTWQLSNWSANIRSRRRHHLPLGGHAWRVGRALCRAPGRHGRRCSRISTPLCSGSRRACGGARCAAAGAGAASGRGGEPGSGADCRRQNRGRRRCRMCCCKRDNVSTGARRGRARGRERACGRRRGRQCCGGGAGSRHAGCAGRGLQRGGRRRLRRGRGGAGPAGRGSCGNKWVCDRRGARRRSWAGRRA